MPSEQHTYTSTGQSSSRRSPLRLLYSEISVHVVRSCHVFSSPSLTKIALPSPRLMNIFGFATPQIGISKELAGRGSFCVWTIGAQQFTARHPRQHHGKYNACSGTEDESMGVALVRLPSVPVVRVASLRESFLVAGERRRTSPASLKLLRETSYSLSRDTFSLVASERRCPAGETPDDLASSLVDYILPSLLCIRLLGGRVRCVIRRVDFCPFALQARRGHPLPSKQLGGVDAASSPRGSDQNVEDRCGTHTRRPCIAAPWQVATRCCPRNHQQNSTTTNHVALSCSGPPFLVCSLRQSAASRTPFRGDVSRVHRHAT